MTIDPGHASGLAEDEMKRAVREEVVHRPRNIHFKSKYCQNQNSEIIDDQLTEF